MTTTAMDVRRRRRTRWDRRRCVPSNPGLLSRGELAFYHVLRQAIPNHLALSLKTRLVDIVGCPDWLWTRPYGRRLAQKHVDFVLFDRDTAAIEAVVELDDRTHELPERRQRDRFLSRLLSRRRIPLIRIRAASRYNLPELQRSIASSIQARPPLKQHESPNLP